MSSANLRLIAGGLTLIVAVLVGLVTGFAGSSAGCVPESGQSNNQPSDQEPAPGPSNSAPGGGFESPPPSVGGGVPGSNALRGIAVDADDRCGRAFSVPSAMTGFLGALVAGGIAGGMLLYAAHRRRPGPAGVPEAVSPASPAMVGAGVPVSGPPGAHAGSHGGPPGAAQAQPSARSARSVAASDGRMGKERALLVQTCIYVRDRATSQAIADHLGRVLSDVGVTTVAPEGRFDPSRHEAGGSASTDDENLDGTIAGVELPGYTDHGQVLRAPVVTVYRRAGR